MGLTPTKRERDILKEKCGERKSEFEAFKKEKNPKIKKDLTEK